VSAGFGVGFTTATRVAISPRPDVLTRPLAVDSAVITTYLLRLGGGGDVPASLERFIVRLHDLVRLREI
ncbi:LysR family transcriptional regulator, partial [Pseudomonas putida]|nr:LysR family transcriptional regulator [Pseudomonas putida]